VSYEHPSADISYAECHPQENENTLPLYLLLGHTLNNVSITTSTSERKTIWNLERPKYYQYQSKYNI